MEDARPPEDGDPGSRDGVVQVPLEFRFSAGSHKAVRSSASKYARESLQNGGWTIIHGVHIL